MFHTRPPLPHAGPDVGEDSALVTAACADPHAFAPLYARYVGPVYRYCYLRLGDRAAAEDATSEVFAKALAGLHGYRDGVFAAWLFRIAHNVVGDVYRRGRPTEQLDAAAEWPDAGPTPADVALSRDRLEALRAALATLPESYRRALELQMAGWSVAESAAALEISAGALKLLRFRALKRLRALLDQPGWESPAEVSHGLE